ncbi:MAG: serine O-acetyltransferase EpsC [Pseudomonadota bacterium]
MDLEGISKITKDIIDTYEKFGGVNRIDRENLPSPTQVIKLLKKIHTLLFPGILGEQVPGKGNIYFFIQSLLDNIYLDLQEQIKKCVKFRCKMDNCDSRACQQLAETYSQNLLNKLPEIRQLLKLDIQAAYDGDPAVKYDEEIIMCYPSIKALATHRISHELYKMEIPLMPRIMSEWAHSATGIDINPGACIGKNFFMDHGTGIVIGETCKIGDHVKIYQGVTLGALSFKKDKDGRVKKGGQRHPTIEDNVTIYANATILGGNTIIGDGSVIGANTWVVKSIPKGSRITISVNQDHV